MRFFTQKLWVLVLGSVFLFGCSENYQAEKAFWQAEQKLKSITAQDVQNQGPEALKPAVQALEQIFEDFPGTPKAAESLWTLAALQIRSQDYTAARRTLKKLIQNFSGSRHWAPQARFQVANTYEMEGNWEKAEPAYWELAEFHPFHVRGMYAPVHIIVHYKEARDAEGQQHAFDLAMDYYRRMIKQVGPIQASAGLRNYKGMAQLAHGQWQAARETWLSLVEELPDSPVAPFALLAAAELSMKRQAYDASIESYQKYLERYPKHLHQKLAMVNLGKLHHAKKEFSASRAWYEKALAQEATQPSVPDIRLVIGMSYQAEGRWEEAQKVYQTLKRDYPESPAALQVPFMQANYFEENGKPETARQILENAIEEWGRLTLEGGMQTAAYAERLQNAAYTRQGDWDRLIQNFEHKIRQEQTPARKGAWLFLKALVTENRLEDKDQAVLLYGEFLEQYPEHPLAGMAKNRYQGLVQPA